MTDKPVIVRLASGAEYGLKSEAEAKRIYPGGVVVRYQDEIGRASCRERV